MLLAVSQNAELLNAWRKTLNDVRFNFSRNKIRRLAGNHSLSIPCDRFTNGTANHADYESSEGACGGSPGKTSCGMRLKIPKVDTFYWSD